MKASMLQINSGSGILRTIAIVAVVALLATPSRALVRSAECVPEEVFLEQLDTNQVRYDDGEILQHVGDSLEDIEFVAIRNHSFSCVDARGSNWIIGTAGGDFSEFLLALDTYFKVIGESNPTYERIKRLLLLYITYRDPFLPASEGFFLHSDNIKLQEMLKDLNITWDAAGGDTPAKADQPALLDALTSAKYQGCSHVKYSLMYPDEYGINVEVAKTLLRAFFDILWNDAVHSRLLSFVIFQGKQTGDTALLVKVNGTCQNQSPLSVPRFSTHSASSMFVAHVGAAEELRTQVLAPWFATLATPPVPDVVQFGKQLNEQGMKQLLHTVAHINSKMPQYLLTVRAAAPVPISPPMTGLITLAVLLFIIATASTSALVYVLYKNKAFDRFKHPLASHAQPDPVERETLYQPVQLDE